VPVYTISVPKEIDLNDDDVDYLNMCCKHGEFVPGIKWLRRRHDLMLKQAKDLWEMYLRNYDENLGGSRDLQTY
jgi:hypothetical protein